MASTVKRRARVHGGDGATERRRRLRLLRRARRSRQLEAAPHLRRHQRLDERGHRRRRGRPAARPGASPSPPRSAPASAPWTPPRPSRGLAYNAGQPLALEPGAVMRFTVPFVVLAAALPPRPHPPPTRPSSRSRSSTSGPPRAWPSRPSTCCSSPSSTRRRRRRGVLLPGAGVGLGRRRQERAGVGLPRLRGWSEQDRAPLHRRARVPQGGPATTSSSPCGAPTDAGPDDRSRSRCARASATARWRARTPKPSKGSRDQQRAFIPALRSSAASRLDRSPSRYSCFRGIPCSFSSSRASPAAAPSPPRAKARSAPCAGSRPGSAPPWGRGAPPCACRCG